MVCLQLNHQLHNSVGMTALSPFIKGLFEPAAAVKSSCVKSGSTVKHANNRPYGGHEKIKSPPALRSLSARDHT